MDKLWIPGPGFPAFMFNGHLKEKENVFPRLEKQKRPQPYVREPPLHLTMFKIAPQ